MEGKTCALDDSGATQAVENAEKDRTIPKVTPSKRQAPRNMTRCLEAHEIEKNVFKLRLRVLLALSLMVQSHE